MIEARRSLVGSTIDGKFEVTSLVGEGGLGSVYRAEQVDLGRPVALKVLHQLLPEQRDLDRFLREGQVLSALQHKNIIQVFSFGVVGGKPYLAVEFLEGKTLAAELADKKKLEWRRSINIVLQVCEALSYAHKNDIAHRDLKPENIMLLDSPEPDTVKVLDFGLSGFLDDSQERQRLTQTGAILGTMHYMSPEACSGQKIDSRSDIYGLGCILYQCLTGSPPFSSNNPVVLLQNHVNEMPAKFSKSQPTGPKQLEQVVFKALQKNPDSRFATMDDFAQALRLISGGSAEEVVLTDVIMESPQKRNAFLTAPVVLLVIFIFAAFISGGILLSVKQEQKASPVLKPKKPKTNPLQVLQTTQKLIVFGEAHTESAPKAWKGAEEKLNELIAAEYSKVRPDHVLLYLAHMQLGYLAGDRLTKFNDQTQRKVSNDNYEEALKAMTEHGQVAPDASQAAFNLAQGLDAINEKKKAYEYYKLCLSLWQTRHAGEIPTPSTVPQYLLGSEMECLNCHCLFTMGMYEVSQDREEGAQHLIESIKHWRSDSIPSQVPEAIAAAAGYYERHNRQAEADELLKVQDKYFKENSNALSFSSAVSFIRAAELTFALGEKHAPYAANLLNELYPYMEELDKTWRQRYEGIGDRVVVSLRSQKQDKAAASLAKQVEQIKKAFK